MSLVPTFVQATNGKFYKNPVCKGRIRNSHWFICFDDSAPPEIVLQLSGEKNQRKVVEEEILQPLGILYTKLRSPQRCMRNFNGRLKNAISFFFTLEAALPVNLITSHEGECKQPTCDCVYYSFGGNKCK